MSYLGNSPGQASQRIVNTEYVTTTKATFTVPGGYALGYLDVHINGVDMVPGDDFTASDGLTFTLAASAVNGDVVKMTSFIPRGLSDGYTKAEADAKYPVKPTGTPSGSKFLRDDNSWQTVTAPSPTAVSDQANTSTGYFDLPAGTTAQRPASPNTGMIRFNTDLSLAEYYDGAAWLGIYPGLYSIDYLVVAGGGGGSLGGGGAGGVLTAVGSTAFSPGASYSITVGSGGSGVVGSSRGSNGGNSSIGSLAIAIGGGGGGGSGSTNPTGISGGSGGGGGTYGSNGGGSGTSGQGNAGGTGSQATRDNSGGGGGAGAAGSNAVYDTIGGAGGVGIQWLNGSYYGGGGGGSTQGTSNGPASGGNGGGGQGNTRTLSDAASGSSGTGGGGGGNQGGTGGNGGGGIVILRYKGGVRASGGTVTVSGGYTYHAFSTSGTFTFTA